MKSGGIRIGRTLVACAGALGMLAASSGGALAMSERAVCPGPAPLGSARCFAHVVTDGHNSPATSSLPKGYGPAQFHGGYKLLTGPPESTPTQTIAIVDAYDDPTISKDLATYDTKFNVPELPTCVTPTSGGAPLLGTAASPCFAKVNQAGTTSPLPSASSGWALEIALDVETAHEICQTCNVVLVEATSSSGENLDKAETTAAALPATEISNSWGTEGEYEGELTENASFKQPRIAVTVASGDKGYEHFGFPAASPNVIDAGGTTLNVTANGAGGYEWSSETTWSGSGSGCSHYFGAPLWQSEALNWSLTECKLSRGVADVAADANPNTGAAVYDSTRYQGHSGWFQVGGTSLASPLIAGVYALAGNAASVEYPAKLPYGKVSALHDVTQGASTGSCSTTACKAGTGYDGPTGVGSPSGTTAF